MKKTTFVISLALILAFVLSPAVVQSQPGGGGYGSGMGPGMMGPGRDPQYQPPSEPLDEKDAKANYNRGKTVYRNNCQLCHGVNGDGNGPAAYSMYPKPADFTDPRFWKLTTHEKISETILYGRGMMPPFRFSPENIKALIDYISHFKKSNRK
jgi:mono/diheme cytochrome c family protein